MATRRIGLSKGAPYTSINEAVGAPTVTDDVEVTVNLPAYPTAADRLHVVTRLEHLINYVMTKMQWPPA